LDAAFFSTATQLVRAQCDVAARVARLPALRASTRQELGRRLAVATAYLHGNLERNVTVADAARQACLSPFHFHRLFGALHGVTPHRYLTSLRLNRARAVLQSSDLAITDVATACGFESTSSFTTLFKRTFGVTPGAFRKNGKAGAAALAVPYGDE
jgi:AraC-like DNA-binding protein